MDNEFCGLIFGEKAPVSATVTGAKQPLFDYAAETAAARKGMEALQKKLGVVSIAAPAEGGQIKSIKVVGARIAREVDKKLDLRPFHQEAGYTLSVLVEFPGSILDITDKSVIETAFAGDGTSLIKGNRDWDRRLGFPKLSADQASAIFDVELKMPPPGVLGIKEIAGVLQYRVSMAHQGNRPRPDGTQDRLQVRRTRSQHRGNQGWLERGHQGNGTQAQAENHGSQSRASRRERRQNRTQKKRLQRRWQHHRVQFPDRWRPAGKSLR